jgi:hypothetical protein
MSGNRKLIVTNCRECPFFGVSMVAIFSKADGQCGCPKQSGPLHFIELGGTSEHDKAVRRYLDGKRTIPHGGASSIPDWCPLRTESVTVTLGS